MKQQPVLNVKIPEDLFRQMLYLCDAEHRTPNNQVLFLLRNSVSYFERAKGHMDKGKLASYDLTPYMNTEKKEESES